MEMTCRDRDRIAMQSGLLGLSALGLYNVLLLSGDDPKGGDQPDAKAVFDMNGTELLGVANRMRREGRLMDSDRVMNHRRCTWARRAITARDLEQPNNMTLAAKAAAGGDFIQTRPGLRRGPLRGVGGAGARAGANRAPEHPGRHVRAGFRPPRRVPEDRGARYRDARHDDSAACGCGRPEGRRLSAWPSSRSRGSWRSTACRRASDGHRGDRAFRAVVEEVRPAPGARGRSGCLHRGCASCGSGGSLGVAVAKRDADLMGRGLVPAFLGRPSTKAG